MRSAASSPVWLMKLEVEACPTVLAEGFEKDIAMVIAPSVTIPCASDGSAQALPPLANVATIQPGPFTVSIPVAARYDELAKAMGLAFTDGKIFFSKEMPEIYLEKPEVYAAKDQLVLKLHIGGPVKKAGLDTAGIDWLVPHQANLRIMTMTAQKLGVPMERVVVTVQDHGNTSAASIPLALSVANAEGRLRKGDVILVEAIGGGLAWGAAVMRW